MLVVGIYYSVAVGEVRELLQMEVYSHEDSILP